MDRQEARRRARRREQARRSRAAQQARRDVLCLLAGMLLTMLLMSVAECAFVPR